MHGSYTGLASVFFRDARSRRGWYPTTISRTATGMDADRIWWGRDNDELFTSSLLRNHWLHVQHSPATIWNQIPSVLVAKSLKPKIEGRKLLEIFTRSFPGHTPSWFGESEPLRETFKLSNLGDSLNGWGKTYFLAERENQSTTTTTTVTNFSAAGVASHPVNTVTSDSDHPRAVGKQEADSTFSKKGVSLEGFGKSLLPAPQSFLDRHWAGVGGSGAGAAGGAIGLACAFGEPCGAAVLATAAGLGIAASVLGGVELWNDRNH